MQFAADRLGSNYAYTLGLAGNRLTVAELSGRSVAYGYDSLYRLTSENVTADPNNHNGTTSYLYDPVGNRQQLLVNGVTANSYTYDADDRLGSDSYDADGNTVNSLGTANAYDFENHMITHGGVTIVYDGDGNRVSETVGGVTTNYLVDTVNPTGYAQVVDELQGAVSRTYSYGLERINENQILNSTWTPSFYGYDGHGSVRQLTSAAGAVTDGYDYDAFGNLSNSTGSTPNNYLFAGEQYDPALALYYNRARYLNTATGRFWGIDTSEGDDSSPISLHKYLYVGANPVDRTDTSSNEIDEVMAGLDIMGTINAISLPNFNQILQSIPRQETLYVRSFAPWDWFGSEPPICAYNCFRGNSRSFTTSRDKGVTSKVTGIVKFLLPSMSLAGSPTAYSDASTDIYGRTATGRPTISANAAGDGKLHMEFAGANPLVPGAPDIDTKLDIAAQVKSGQVCYSGHLYGDAFPNAEVFVVNSHDQATMLQTFATTGGQNTGPVHLLPGNNNRDMGSFSSKCAPE